MTAHTVYLGTRDGVFRVLMEGERPASTSNARYVSAMLAIGVLSDHLQNNYRLYARGVDRLCIPDGIIELSGLAIREREDADRVLLDQCGPEVLPQVSYVANRVI